MGDRLTLSMVGGVGRIVGALRGETGSRMVPNTAGHEREASQAEARVPRHDGAWGAGTLRHATQGPMGMASAASHARARPQATPHPA